MLNTTLEVRCIVESHPLPTFVVWKRLFPPAPPSSQVIQKKNQDDMFGTLEKTVTREDEGNWTCTAETDVMKRNAEFAVIVLGKNSTLVIAWD